MGSVAARSEGTGASEKLLSIGQVLTRLKPSFPDLTPSKLRFLEEQGLIHPQRTESGYRKFTSADVERIRFILSLQRDRYLPLKVIKAYVDDLDAGNTPSIAGLLAPVDSLPASSVPSFFSREELLSRTGATGALLTDAVSFGLIDNGRRFDQQDARVLELLVELARCGIEPRHLRAYRAMADREAGLIASLTDSLSRRGGADAQAHAEKLPSDLADCLTSLHAAVLKLSVQRHAQ